MSKTDLLTQHGWVRVCAAPMRLALTLLFASLAIGLSGCGAISIDISGADQGPSGVSQSSSIQDSATALTLNDYVEQCVAYRTDPRGDYATNFEAVGALRDMAERFGMMSPPSEVAEVHRARIRLTERYIEILSKQSPDRIPALVFVDFFHPELYAAMQEYNESQYTLSADTRNVLLTQGCIGTEDEIREAQPTLTPDENHSIEDYARWCSRDELNGDGEYATYGEATSAFIRELARYEAMSPPTELVSLHETRTDVFEAVIEIYGSFPRDETLSGTLRVDLAFENTHRWGITPIFDSPSWEHAGLDSYWQAWVRAFRDLRLDTQSILTQFHRYPGKFIGGICGMHQVN